jgi:hypothetical protein
MAMARRNAKMRINRKGTNGTGRDIPTVYVPSRPAVPPFAARDKGDIAGHCPVLSRCPAPNPLYVPPWVPPFADAGCAEPALEAA